MVGAIMKEPNAREVVAKAFDKRLIINATDEHSLRFVPPLILTHAQVDQALAILAEVLDVAAPVLQGLRDWEPGTWEEAGLSRCSGG